eukprot:6292247-Amphidinium_carterae.1
MSRTRSLTTINQPMRSSAALMVDMVNRSSMYNQCSVRYLGHQPGKASITWIQQEKQNHTHMQLKYTVESITE